MPAPGANRTTRSAWPPLISPSAIVPSTARTIGRRGVKAISTGSGVGVGAAPSAASSISRGAVMRSGGKRSEVMPTTRTARVAQLFQALRGPGATAIPAQVGSSLGTRPAAQRHASLPAGKRPSSSR
jgi:hypothetical protein